MHPEREPAPSQPERKSRLSTAEELLLPLVRAYTVTDCALYWIPVRSFPPSASERRWLMQFFDRLFAVLTAQLGLRIEVFLRYKAVLDHARLFQSTAMEFAPILGIGRRPGDALPLPPNMDDLEPVLSGKREFDLREWVPDYCYWFHRKNERRQREAFLGTGGMTMLALAPDPATVPPQLPFSETFRNKHAIFKTIDVEKLLQETSSLRDAFHAKSKELFGADIQDDPRYPGFLFILPYLASSDFFDRPSDERSQWFEAFDLYINESPEDEGILLATKLEIEDELMKIVAELREERD